MVGFVICAKIICIEMGLVTNEFILRALWYVYHNKYAIIRDANFWDPHWLHPQNDLVEDIFLAGGSLPIFFMMVFMQGKLALPVSHYCEKSLLEKGMVLLPSKETNIFNHLFPSSHYG